MSYFASEHGTDFYVIEGSDAAGKNTQATKLAEHFRQLGRRVLHLSFPRYKTQLGAAILRHLKSNIVVMEIRSRDSSDHTIDGQEYFVKAQEDALIFQCMMVADKYDAAGEIEEELNKGSVVICDRWWQSAYCYGAADYLSPGWLASVHAALPQASYNFWIDVPQETALERRPDARDRYERDREKQAKVRGNYSALWRSYQLSHRSSTTGEYVIIDGTPSADAVHRAILAELNYD